jgi:exonuclease III
MKLISWNIRQGGGDRLGAICTAIATHDPDVVVLSEIRARSIREIGSSLWMKPWSHIEHVTMERDTIAVCVLSKVPIAVRDFCPVPNENVDLPS